MSAVDFTRPQYTLDDLVGLSEEFREKKKFRTKKVNLVLISGKKHHGKTTISDYLFHELTNKFPSLLTQQEALATPIKINAMEFYGWDGEKDEKGRRLLQEIGDTARNYNENIFVEMLENRALSGLFLPHIVLIDDWRYPNELSYFANNFLYEITTIRVIRDLEDKSETSKHRSENSLPETIIEDLTNSVKHTWSDGNIASALYNFVVFNNGSIEDLCNKLGGVIDHLSNKVITY